MNATATDDPDRAADADPLGTGWTVVTAVIGVMAALIALGGMTLSFRAVSAEMVPAFGARWAWLVPIVVDMTVFVFSGVDLVLARKNMNHPLARWTVYVATAGTVLLNYSAGGNLAGRVAHVLMPAIWVVFIELMRHVVHHQVGLTTGTLRDPVPVTRWALSPWPTLKLWRRMVLWQQRSYSGALDQERTRLRRIAALRQAHGLFWRFRVSAADRLSIAMGETTTPTVVETAPAPAAAVAEQPPAALSLPVPQSAPVAVAPERGGVPEQSGGRVQQSAPAEQSTAAEQSAPPAPKPPGQSRAAEPVRAERRAPAQRQSAEPAEQSAPAGAEQSSVPEQSGEPTAEQSNVLATLTDDETRALRKLAEEWAPRIPSQGAIRNVLPVGANGKRCGATRAIRIQTALRERVENPDDPDPLSDAVDAAVAAELG